MNYTLKFLWLISLLVPLCTYAAQESDSLGVEKRSVIIIYDKPDSVVSYLYDETGPRTPNSKLEFEYDVEGNMTLNSTYFWDERRESWGGSYSVLKQYNSEGKTVLSQMNKWNRATMDWSNYKKTETAYDVDSVESCVINFAWDLTLNRWNIIDLTVSVLEDEEPVKRNYSWNDEVGEWDIVSRMRILVDNGDTVSVKEVYDLNTKQMEWSSKSLVKIDSLGCRTTVGYSWNADDKGWEAKSKFVMRIDSEMNMRYDERYKWSVAIAGWEKYLRSDIKSDESGQFVEIVNCSAKDNEWVYTTKKEREYSSDGYVEQDVDYQAVYISDDQSVTWLPQFMQEYKYLEGKSDETYSYTWDSDLKKWMFIEKDIYYYKSNVTTDVRLENESEVVVFPNPCREKLLFKNVSLGNSMIYLYDRNGKEIVALKICNESFINVQNLTSGIYFYRIVSDNKTINGKFLKE